MEDYFDFVVTSQQVSRSKPDPQMYLEALKNIDLKAEECIIFEDTESGVAAARNAGIDVIVVNEKEKKKFSDALTVSYTHLDVYKRQQHNRMNLLNHIVWMQYIGFSCCRATATNIDSRNSSIFA